MSIDERQGNTGETKPSPEAHQTPAPGDHEATPVHQDRAHGTSGGRPRDSSGRFSLESPLPSLVDIVTSWGPSWHSWLVVAKAASGELRAGGAGGTPPDVGATEASPRSSQAKDFEFFTAHTGRTKILNERFKAFFLLIGRGGGKSRFCGACGVALAIQDHPYLAPGEIGICALFAQSRKAARQLFNYVLGILNSDPRLKRMIVSTTQSSIVLNNNITIEISTSNQKLARGPTYVAVIIDEVCFFPTDDSANSDVEIINSVMPGLARSPTSQLWVISSPFQEKGVMAQAEKKYWANNEASTLFWRASTLEMNETFDKRAVEKAMQENAAFARTEFYAEWRAAGQSYLSAEILDEVIVRDRVVLPPIEGTKYFGFVDLASGGGKDSSVLAIAHAERRSNPEGTITVAILDLLIERTPPFSPTIVIQEFSAVLKSYGLSFVVADRYAEGFVVEAFAKNAIRYKASKLTKSEIYREASGLFTSGRAELLDSSRLRSQILSLERRASKSGRDTVDNPRGSCDDVANAATGALVLAAERKSLQHGTLEHSGHRRFSLEGGWQFCRGQNKFGDCIWGQRKVAQEDKWAELDLG